MRSKQNVGFQDKITIYSSKIRILSWKPRVFLYKQFLTSEECNHLIDLAKDRLEESRVIISEGKIVKNNFRTSSQAWIPRNHDIIVSGIERKISKWSMLPPDHGEQLQVLKYEVGGQFKPHYDHIPNVQSDQRGGPRVATIIIFLSNVTKGGETAFPYGKSSAKFDDSWSECGKSGLGIKPRRGDALLFYTLDPAGRQDTFSLHAGCPVLEGTKWSATKWLHMHPFDVPNLDILEDFDPDCAIWAKSGECERNPEVMVGNAKNIGLCQKSCKLLKYI
ncbi:hypothetical protein KC19_4G157300 [Ceratodon purpureus]|uniref:procollagen-proline 4-dioxygenase n=1 Tax=Ceratodon purpureus TaxID=3225 RepID=A0A8T0IBC7_CERPU|nr:hypothetical protein KC19_4G157300 [Ceratodon purpureus]